MQVLSPRVTRAVVTVLAIGAVGAIIPFGINSWVAARYDRISTIPSAVNACTKIHGVNQSEDIAVDWSHQRAFISGMNQRGSIARGIYRLDFSHGMTLMYVTPPALPVELHPHGLGLYTGSDGRQSLFVVNHPKNRSDGTGHSILIFDVESDGTLRFNADIKGGTALYSPNDVAPVGHREFYVTNDAAGQASKFKSWLGRMRMLLGWDLTGNVVFFDGAQFRTVADRLQFANGINTSADGLRVYVAESFGPSVSTFLRDPQTSSLTLQSRTALPGSPDNIDVAPDGRLFVAIFPRMREVLGQLLNDPAKRPSSAVVELTPEGNAFRIKPVWLDDGRRITKVTIGAPYAKSSDGYYFLLGTIEAGDDYVLACAPGVAHVPP